MRLARGAFLSAIVLTQYLSSELFTIQTAYSDNSFSTLTILVDESNIQSINISFRNSIGDVVTECVHPIRPKEAGGNTFDILADTLQHVIIDGYSNQSCTGSPIGHFEKDVDGHTDPVIEI